MFPYYRGRNPLSGEISEHKWYTGLANLHHKINTAQSQTDHSPPKTNYPGLRYRNLQPTEERLDKIDFENRRLIGRLRRIYSQGGAVDNEHERPVERRSLNADKRMQDMVRIAEENRKMTSRLRTTRASVDKSRQLRDYREVHLKRAKMIAKRQPKLYAKVLESSFASRNSPDIKSMTRNGQLRPLHTPRPGASDSQSVRSANPSSRTSTRNEQRGRPEEEDTPTSDPKKSKEYLTLLGRI